jgi:hypothetical protein
MLAVCSMLVSCSILSSTLHVQAIYFFITSFDFQRTNGVMSQKMQLFLQISVYTSVGMESRDNVVGIAIGYGLDVRRVGVRVLVKKR